MDWQAWLTLGLTLGALLTLIFSRFSTDFVMMAVVAVLGASGILTDREALEGFGNSGLITVAAMFIVAAGIRSSGGVDLMVNKILGRPEGVRGALLRLVAPVMALSGFLNNTPVVATLIPAVAGWAKRLSIPTSMLMIPLSYAAILGGTLTLIGTSTNLVVNGQYQALTGKPGFALFDITAVGLAAAVVGLILMIVVFPWLLPRRTSPDEKFSNMKEYTFEVAVASDGPLVGKTIVEAGLRHLRRIYLVEIERNGRIVTAVPSEERLQGGDRLVFVGDTAAIIDVLRINGLVPSDSKEPIIEKSAPERRLVEAVVSPYCESIGQSIRDGRFRDRYGAVVLAVARDGEHVQGNLNSIILEPGDVLLLEARPAFVTRQRYSRDFLVISDLEENRPNHSRALTSWIILFTVVALATAEVMSMLNAALIGAGLMVVTGCCTFADAKRSLDLTVIITIGASFALGAALEKTGAASFLGSQVLGLADGNAWLLLLFTYIAVSVLTEVITNNAAAILMLPIVLSMTNTLGLNQDPFVITLMMAASASFATPIGYQTNLMVYGPGGYRFTDFLKVGVVMNITTCIVTVIVVPQLWSLTG